MSKFRPGAVVQFVDTGKESCDVCSRVFDGSEKAYFKDDRPWVIMRIEGTKPLVPCERWGFLISPLAHDPTNHGEKPSVDIPPGTIPRGVYDHPDAKRRADDEHFLIQTVCSVVSHAELRHHTFGAKQRPISLASEETEDLWAEAMIKHHEVWTKERLTDLYKCWCEQVLKPGSPR